MASVTAAVFETIRSPPAVRKSMARLAGGIPPTAAAGPHALEGREDQGEGVPSGAQNEGSRTPTSSRCRSRSAGSSYTR